MFLIATVFVNSESWRNSLEEPMPWCVHVHTQVKFLCAYWLEGFLMGFWIHFAQPYECQCLILCCVLPTETEPQRHLTQHVYSRITGDQDTATSAYLHVTVVKSQRMFLCKLEKQVKEHFVRVCCCLALVEWDPLPLLTHTLLKERDIWKELWVWGQEGKPRICHFRLWLEVFQAPSCYVSLSLSRGHLRMKSCPYHFPVIMMHEPTRWPAFPGKVSPPRVLQGEGGFASSSSWHFPSPGSFPPLWATSIGDRAF